MLLTNKQVDNYVCMCISSRIKLLCKGYPAHNISQLCISNISNFHLLLAASASEKHHISRSGVPTSKKLQPDQRCTAEYTY